MTPKEKFDNAMWRVLQKIRFISISARKGEALIWPMQNGFVPNMPPIGIRQSMLFKIEEWGGVKIIKEEAVDVTYGKNFIYTFELIQPKFDELYKEFQSIIGVTEHYEKLKEIDYDSSSERRAWEKKWDVLQAIWTVYQSSTQPDEVNIPISNLEIKGRRKAEIVDILKGLSENGGCFSYSHRGSENYLIKNINHTQLAETYKKTELIYDKFAKVYRERTGNIKKVKPPRQDNLLFTKELISQITAGDLVAYSDGTIRYKDIILDLRNQLKDLCRLFMRNPKRLLTIDDIREEIINADKREATPNSTIAKYVSELRNSLQIHFKKDVIFNQKEEGWYFKL